MSGLVQIWGMEKKELYNFFPIHPVSRDGTGFYVKGWNRVLSLSIKININMDPNQRLRTIIVLEENTTQ